MRPNTKPAGTFAREQPHTLSTEQGVDPNEPSLLTICCLKQTCCTVPIQGPRFALHQDGLHTLLSLAPHSHRLLEQPASQRMLWTIGVEGFRAHRRFPWHLAGRSGHQKGTSTDMWRVLARGDGPPLRALLGFLVGELPLPPRPAIPPEVERCEEKLPCCSGQTFRCFKCDNTFNRWHHLKQHLQSHANAKDGCGHCGLKVLKRNLKRREVACKKAPA